MLVIKQKRIYRDDIKSNPNILYVFGDNLDRRGFGGQAKEMRGEPNSFGIATKRSISHHYPDDYFFDEQDDVIDILEKEFNRLEMVLLEDRTIRWENGQDWDVDELVYDAVVIPLDGIGTGLSKMPLYAPKALEYIEERFRKLEELRPLK